MSSKYILPRSSGIKPVVWLGQSVDTSSICAGHPELNSLPFLTSLGCAIRRPSLRKTHLNSELRLKLGITGPIMIDSGGFVLSTNPSARWNVRHVKAAFAEIQADVFVTLDYPPHRKDSKQDRLQKIARSIGNFESLSDQFPDKIMMPVIHGRSIAEIERSIKLIARINRAPKWVGLGGVVPLLQGRPGLAAWSGNAASFIAQAIMMIRCEFGSAMIHVFGAGGTRTFPAVFAFGADSGDSIGWRHAAGFGSIFLPLKSQRVINWNQKKAPPRKLLDHTDLADIRKCNCPICRTRSRADQRIEKLRQNFYNRSIHNAWTLSRQFDFWPASRSELRSLIASGKLGRDWAQAARCWHP